MKTSSSGKRARIDAAGRWIAVVCAVLAAACARTTPLPAQAAAVGGWSPSVEVPVEFAFDSLDERSVSGGATRGKPTIVAFVTTASLAAQAQVDFLVAMSRHDGDRVNYAVVAMEDRDSRELVELYKKALSIPFPVAMADAPTLAGSGAFGDVRAVPVTVILDRKGRVVWRLAGRVSKSEELRAALRGR